MAVSFKLWDSLVLQQHFMTCLSVGLCLGGGGGVVARDSQCWHDNTLPAWSFRKLHSCVECAQKTVTLRAMFTALLMALAARVVPLPELALVVPSLPCC
jgi:hypothetical protein